MARPRANDWLDDEIGQWKSAGLDVVISLLERAEVTELELQREAQLCEANDITFVSYPIADRSVPSSHREVERLCLAVTRLMEQGRSVAFHCRAGIGRSAVMAACTLVCTGTAVDKAFSDIRSARGVEVPDTEEQYEWVAMFKEAYSSKTSEERKYY